MVVGRKVAGDLDHCEEMLPKFRDELRSAITDDDVEKTIVPKNFTHNDTCGLLTSDLFSVGHAMCHFSMSISHC